MRIGHPLPTGPTLPTLLSLQAAHRRTIAFENLSVRMGEGVECSGDAVFAKLVAAARGGFCFEHNRLFADMLAVAGYDCRLVASRVLLGNPQAIPARSHCLLLVRLREETWIADAGFGGAYTPPMELADGGTAQSSDGARHRLRQLAFDDARGDWLLERKGPRAAGDGRGASDTIWEAQYAFDMAPTVPADLAMGCHWAATHPSSRFTNHTVVSLCLPNGFASLVDRSLTVWEAGRPPLREQIGTPSRYRNVLSERFGLELSTQQVGRLPLFDPGP